MNLAHKFFLGLATVSTINGLGLLTVVQAAIYQLNWTGQFAEYKIQGVFSFDDDNVPGDGIVRKNDLNSFNFSVLTSSGILVKSFPNNHLAFPEFNFNFDTSTRQILQDGVWDSPNGITIGEAKGVGLSFWSIDDIGPGAPISFPDGVPSPHVHLRDYGNEFPDLPKGFGSNLDVAFFNRTNAELLGDPTAPNTLGKQLTATPVPEPISLLGSTLAIGLGALFKKRLKK
ncbi:MAG: hypothetical protein RLZZ490_2411 [Cyanobacteriota bacterium]|jgi:hypothetical protein